MLGEALPWMVLSITALYSPSVHAQKLAHVSGMHLALLFFFLMLVLHVSTLVPVSYTHRTLPTIQL